MPTNTIIKVNYKTGYAFFNTTRETSYVVCYNYNHILYNGHDSGESLCVN